MKKVIFSMAMLFLTFNLMSCGTGTKIVKEPGPSIKGVVYNENGVPLSGAVVSVYLSNASLFHGPANYNSNYTKDDGSFNLNLPDGKYFLIARKRIYSGPTGPLKQGDYNGEFINNPVIVKAGETNSIQITTEKIEGLMLFSPMHSVDNKIQIKGIVKDEKGNIKEGFYVVGYVDPAVEGKPQVIAKPTNKKGEFTLYIPATGKYYLIARQAFRKKPLLGELIGFYGGEESTSNSIEIKNEKGAEGVELVVKPLTEQMLKKAQFIGDKVNILK